MARYLIITLIFSTTAFADIIGFYLSWEENPATTMSIHWITPLEEDSDSIFLENTEQQFVEIVGSHTTIANLCIHHATIRDLDPDLIYNFRFAFHEKKYSFKTAPSELESFSFIVGGDAGQIRKLFEAMNTMIVKTDPLFCVIGGDIAYAIKDHQIRLSSGPLNKWVSFFSTWKKQMITKDNRVIPLIVTPGNHDITKEQSELFFQFFPHLQEQSYQHLQFGNYLSLILLDTNHFSSITGEQTNWLKKTLQRSHNVTYRFPIYHEASYPSYYSFQAENATLIRENWCPLFDDNDIPVVFENHNHTFKRTYPIKAGKIHPKGVIYLGDGCWGVIPRKPQNHWYLAKKGRKNNVYQVYLTKTQAEITALGIDGEPFDNILVSP